MALVSITNELPIFLSSELAVVASCRLAMFSLLIGEYSSEAGPSPSRASSRKIFEIILKCPTSTVILLKELMNNAIDAGTTSIYVLVSPDTANKIEVRDNG